MTIRIKNPFKFDVEVAGDFFCGRKEDIEELSDYIFNQTNIIMFSKRRIGKSSLIKEVFQSHLSDSVLRAHIDIYSISSMRELYIKLLEGVQDSLKGKLSTLEKASLMVNELQKYFVGSKVSMVISASPELKIESVEKDYFKAIENLFRDYLSYVKAKDITFVFAIDEFQKIASLGDANKIEELLRTIVNKREQLGSFIFTGSKRNILLSMFNDSSRAFFKLGSEVLLKPIEEEVFYEWALKRFQKKGVLLDRTAFRKLYDEVDGETRLIQQVCHEIFKRNDKGFIIDENVVMKNIELIVDKKLHVAQLFDRYSAKQQSALKVIVGVNSKEVYVKDALELYGISKASMQAAIKMLLKENTIFEESDKYAFEDIEFKLWIKRLLI